jgi:hypothetical protein
MEWTIPLQNLEVGKINIDAPTQASKLLSHLSYSDGDVSFNCLSILLPLLPIKSYDAASGRLQLSLQTVATATKLQAFQDMLINAVTNNQRSWFPGKAMSEKDEIRHGFQPFVDSSVIHLYCPSSSVSLSNEVQIYSGKEWTRGVVSPSMFTVGKQVRLAIKFQGLSFHQHPVTRVWTGKFRLQHRITAILTS